MPYFDALRKAILGGATNTVPAGNGITGGTPPTMKNDFQLPNFGGTATVDPNAPQEPPTGFSTLKLPTPEQGQQQAATQAMGPFAPSQDTQGGMANEDVASGLNSALYGVSGPEKTPGSQPQGGGMSPTQQYFALRGQQANDRANGTGLYFIDPSKAFSPEQIRQQYNAADQAYGSQLDAIAVDALKESKPEMTSGQQSAFNTIVSSYNKSPLIAAADRVPVLKNAITAARAKPDDGALQLNLAYSYIQALDTYQSSVREGELNNINSIDSKIGQLQNFATQMTNGQIVRPEVVKQMADAAENIVTTINDAAKNKAKSFKSQAEAQGLGDVWAKYESGFTPSYNVGTGSNDTAAKDAQALKTINPATGKFYTQQEIDDYKRSKGIGGQSFNSVGNTQVSIQIPESSRLPYVNNNPGNLKYVGQAGAHAGEKGFAKFSTPEAGFHALTKQVQLDQSRGLTLESFIHKYAPPIENDTKQYIAQAESALGVPSNTPINKLSPVALAKFIAMKESSTKVS